MDCIVYCADVIARYGSMNGPFVLIERLGAQKGFGLPGGKQEPGELLSETARREFLEETGLALSVTEVFATCADADRDPRGHFVTTVFIGIAEGDVRDEDGKTRVHLLAEQEAFDCRDRFAFDHFLILEKYLKSTRG